MSTEYWKIRFENESLKAELEDETINKLKRQLHEKTHYILLLEQKCHIRQVGDCLAFAAVFLP
jgi:hypothetical protein